MDRSYRILAAKFVRRQAKQLAAQVEGIRLAEDIEFVHRARVATRRLRAALRMFPACFGRRTAKRWRRRVREITEELGAARDRDVQIAFLCAVVHGLEEPAACSGLARLLVDAECAREDLQPAVLKAVRRLKSSGVIDDIQATTKRMLRKVNVAEVALGSSYARRKTAKHIRHELNELLSYQDSLADSEDQQRHHAMRIAAKRLRYTLEISNPVYSGRLDPVINAVKRLQTLLGDLHDCDVWEAHLDRFAEDQRQRIADYYGNEGPWSRLDAGVAYLRDDRRRRRKEIFVELVAYWTELSGQNLWQQLADVLESGGDAPSDPGNGRPPKSALPSERTNGTDPAAAHTPAGPRAESHAPPARPRNEMAEDPSRRPTRLPHHALRRTLSR